jgi:hypothetical protein
MVLTFSGLKIDAGSEVVLRDLIDHLPDQRLKRKWKRVEVRIHAPITAPTPVECVHVIWNPDYVAQVAALGDLPRIASGTVCAAGSRLVEVSFVSRDSGGMGSHHQYDGWFVSLVLTSDCANVIDAGIEKAY